MRTCLPALAAVLALSACHRGATAPAAAAQDSPAAPPAAAADFTPTTGGTITAGEVPVLEQINRENIRVIDSVLPSLVRISATVAMDPRADSGNGSHLTFPYERRSTTPLSEVAYGAGVVIKKDGLIVTNSHVIDEAQAIEVQLADHRVFPASVVASDSQVDVAILKIDAHDLKPLPWGDSDKIRVGEQVFAIGNPFDLGDSASRGIISATGRNIPEPSASFQDYLQTDAAINPGNSGGALVNIHGELIGINVEIASTSGADRGVGFALPSNLLRYAVSSLLKTGLVKRGFLGVTLPSIVDEGVIAQLGLGTGEGALLAGVYPGSPAARAKLQLADFITEIDGHKVGSISELGIIAAQLPVGRQAEVKYIRDGEYHSTFLKVAQAPSSFGREPVPIMDESSEMTSPLLTPGAGANVLSGLQITDLTDKLRSQYHVDNSITSGAIITGVQTGSLAGARGFERGDVIEMVCVRRASPLKLMNAGQLSGVTASLRPDQGVALLVQRGVDTRFLYLPPLK